MMATILLSSSILSADFSQLGNQIREVEEAGVDWIHIDVMDGHFVPNITMGPFIVEHCRKLTTLPIDVHLMIEKPELHIDSFSNAGANHLSIHIENNPNVYRTLEAIRANHVKPGIVLNPGTPASSITSVIHLVDIILVMTVNPGFSGQKFIPDVVSKISQVREMLITQHSKALIQVDGGITEETLPLTYSAGARVFVSATSIFKYPQGIAAGIHCLRSSVS